MTEENLKLRIKNNALREQNAELMKENSELKEQNAKLMERIETMKTEKTLIKEKPSLNLAILNSSKTSRAFENEKTISKKDCAKRIKLSANSVPNWLIEGLAWIKRREMANSALSYSSQIFKELCWPKLHGNVKLYYAKPLGFYCEQNELGAVAVLHRDWNFNWLHQFCEKGEKIPIAQILRPEYILGFLDGKIMEFLKNVIKLNKISLKPEIEMNAWKGSDIAAMHNFLTKFSSNLFELDFTGYGWRHFGEFHRLFPEIFDQIQSVAIEHYADDDSFDDFLFNWLIKMRPERKHKILPLHMADEAKFEFIERVKQEFVGSTQQNTFFIKFNSNFNFENFKMENAQTGELMTLYNKEDQNIVARYGKGEEALKRNWKRTILNAQQSKLIFVSKNLV